MIHIYILKLSYNKYYIGKTSNPSFRLNQHFKSGGSQWTKKYKPLEVLELIDNCDNFDEDKYTLKYMEKYGIDNVRGGSFCTLKLSNELSNVINKMLNTSQDKCYNCNKTGHYITQCPEKIWKCSYCDKEFKTQKGTKYHENIYCKGNPKYTKINYNEIICIVIFIIVVFLLSIYS